MIRANGLLLLAGGLAGFLSSISTLESPNLYSRGVVLGVFLSVGIILTNKLGKTELMSNQPPLTKTILSSATIAGILGGIGVFGMTGEIDPYYTEIFPTPISCSATIVTAYFYSLTMHCAYALRWRMRSFRKIKTFALISIAGSLACTSRFLFSQPIPFERVALIILFTGFPFAVFWAIAVMSFDPAWSFERWNKTISKSKNR